MKLSTLTNIKDITSLTVHVYSRYSVVEVFIKGNKRPKLKVYKKLDIDLLFDRDTDKNCNNNVEHLGVKRSRYFNDLGFYANIYNY